VAELREYDGVAVTTLAQRTGAARIHAYDEVESTMDIAHALARSGAVHGSVVLAETQRAGRGRERREWQSPAGGVWLTVLLRTVRPDTLGVLPLRIGMAAADALDALDALAGERIGLKWPNDLIAPDGKLGGVLSEARWRGDRLDWVAVGVGINVGESQAAGAAGLGGTVRRSQVVARVVPALLRVAERRGELTRAELAAFASRDVALGRMISAPVPGVVTGINSAGSLLVGANGVVTEVRSGSIVFEGRTQLAAANGQWPMANGQ
jgi:BirA family transcriptional regulator, biotin operon repressor / biotin---[acetyl-CoA-carboxylase] ligase